MNPRERALQRLARFSPKLHEPGEVIEELVCAWQTCEVARDLIVQYRQGQGVACQELQDALLVLDERSGAP